MDTLHSLWWKTFRVWFGVVALYYLVWLPALVWFAYHTNHSVQRVYGFLVNWLVLLLIAALIIGWCVAHYAERKKRYENVNVRLDAMRDVIVLGRELRPYANPIRLGYEILLFVWKWIRLVFAFALLALCSKK